MLMLRMMLEMVVGLTCSVVKVMSAGRERVMPKGYCSGVSPVAHVT